MSTTLQAESFAEVNIVERTLLDAAYDAGTALVVASTEGFSPGEAIYIGTPGREGCEKGVVAAIADATTITLTSALELPHSRFESVVGVVGDSIHIYRATNIDGTVPEDGDFSVLATRSIDPDQQSTYYTDSTGGSDYWYKMTYYNADLNQETALADATAARGDDFGHYTSIRAIRVEAGLENAHNLKDTTVDQHRRDAEAEVNSSLANVYTTPFTPVPKAIQAITTQLAAALLLSSVYGGQSDRYDKRLKEVRANLAKMAESKSLTDDTGAVIDTSTDAISSWPNDSTETTRVRDGGSKRAFRMGQVF